MRVKYYGAQGTTKWSRSRFAVVTWSIAEKAKAETLVYMMDALGWTWDGYGDEYEGSAWFLVSDRDEYEQFMEDWKEAKRRVREEKRTCSKH